MAILDFFKASSPATRDQSPVDKHSEGDDQRKTSIYATNNALSTGDDSDDNSLVQDGVKVVRICFIYKCTVYGLMMFLLVSRPRQQRLCGLGMHLSLRIACELDDAECLILDLTS